MKVWENVIARPELMRVLKQIAVHPANGYLFLGARGSGKRYTANHVAAELLKVDEVEAIRHHPDFLVLAREEGAKEIKVKQARDLIARLSLTSAKGGHQVVLIEEVDRLNEESANSLLKVIEEPPAGVVFLCVSDREERIMGTIRSRLVPIRFLPLDVNVIRDELIKRGQTAEDAGIAAHRSHGAIGEAISLVDRLDEVTAEHEEAIRLMRVLIDGSSGRVVSELERLAKKCQAADDSEAAWENELLKLQDAATTIMKQDGERSRELAHAIVWAWRLVGSAISPHLALEWGALKPYRSSQDRIPTFIKTLFV
ncbi:MAG: AAA family ATPase [Patescibacteria group bacterium]